MPPFRAVPKNFGIRKYRPNVSGHIIFHFIHVFGDYFFVA